MVIAPDGITIGSTWLGLALPFSRHHEPLDAGVGDYIPWESDEIEGVGLGSHCLFVPAGDRDALKEALWSALDRAQSLQWARAGYGS